MEKFSVVCLIVILIVVQHLINWIWRKCWEDVSLGGLGFAATIISIVISLASIYHIILWGKDLI